MLGGYESRMRHLSSFRVSSCARGIAEHVDGVRLWLFERSLSDLLTLFDNLIVREEFQVCLLGLGSLLLGYLIEHYYVFKRGTLFLRYLD